jgi:hypothetical protein
MDPLNGDSAEGGGADPGGAGEEPIGSAAFSGSLKRSRSSLDYKGDPSSDKIMPQDARSKIFDAATRGSSSSRSKSDEANPFAGMSSEEIIRHLYENPELAKSLGIDPAVVSAAANGGTPKKPSYRMQLLQKQGIPFVQWAVILLAVGFALYKVFKLLKPPTATVKQKVKRKGGKKIAEKAPLREDLVLNKVVAEIEGAGDEPKDGSGKGAAKKPNKKKLPKKTKTKPAPSGSSKSKDDDSDDSDAEDAAPTSKAKQKKVTLVEEPVVIVQDEDSSGWQTVGTKSVVPAVATNGVANKAPVVKPPNGSSIPAPPDGDEDRSHPEKKKKKSKKKKPDNGTVAPEASDPASTSATPAREAKSEIEEDEALALRLQAEENRLSVESSEEDVWAEVATRKKKNKS